MSVNAGRTSLRALFMKGWDEIPAVMGSSAMGLFGIGLCGFAMWRYYKNDGDNRRYKMSYIVYRPDDPRAKKVHKD